MDNSISYSAGGKRFTFATPLQFENITNEQIAVRVFLAVSFDRDTRLQKGEIPISLSDEKRQLMTDYEIIEWHRITNIEFIDYIYKKKLSMNHMSDFQGNFKVESFE